MFHEVGPDEQNAQGPMEAVSDLGTKSLCEVVRDFSPVYATTKQIADNYQVVV